MTTKAMMTKVKLKVMTVKIRLALMMMKVKTSLLPTKATSISTSVAMLEAKVVLLVTMESMTKMKQWKSVSSFA